MATGNLLLCGVCAVGAAPRQRKPAGGMHKAAAIHHKRMAINNIIVPHQTILSRERGKPLPAAYQNA